MQNYDQLITNLVSDLTKKPKQLPILLLAIIWWLATWAYVSVATLLLGPLRPDVHIHLAHEHQFQIETFLGLFAGLCVTVCAWYSAVPGLLKRKWLFFSIGLVIVWISFYIVGIFSPALEPSMLGKREYCYLEAFLYSMPPTLGAAILLAKRSHLHRRQTGLLIGLSAGMIPALLMQVACMYEPWHILHSHIFPGLLNAVVGVVLFILVKKMMLSQASF